MATTWRHKKTYVQVNKSRQVMAAPNSLNHDATENSPLVDASTFFSLWKGFDQIHILYRATNLILPRTHHFALSQA